MDNFYGDERISSYLDGELSADEQARFEERLAENAELRQLVEELRALRGNLDLLPRYQLEPDFAERVLRRAEHQMLIGGDGGSSDGALRASASGESNAPPQTQPASVELAQPSHAVLDESRRWQRRIVRPLVYAGAAIAAAILIMVFTPPGGNEVAQNRSAEKPVQRGDGPVSSTSKDERALSGLAVERSKTPAQENPASPQVANQSNGIAKDGKPIPDARVNESLETDHSKLVEGAAAKQAVRSLSPSDGSLAGSPAATSNKPADHDSLSQLRSTAAKADQSGRAARMDDTELADKPISSQTSDKQHSAEALGVARRGVEGNGGKSGLADGGQSDQGRHYSNANDLAKANEILRRHGYGTAQANLLVASYEVSPDTSNCAFLGLLAKHRIAMRPATDGAPPVSSQLMDQVSREAGARSEAWLEQGRPIPDDKTAANGRPSQTPQLGAILAAEEPRRDLEIIYVEGSLEQITELVSDLDASKTEFRSLAVDRTTVKKLQLLRKPDNAATPTDAMGDVHARGEAVPESKPMGLAIDDRVRRRESGGIAVGGAVPNGTVANGTVANGVGAGGAAANAAGAAGTAADRPANANIYSYHPDDLAAPATANRVPREEKNRPSIAKSEAGKELHGLREGQAEAKDAASQPGNKAQTADKSAPADSNAPVAKGGEAEILTQPAAGFGVAKAGSDDRNKAVPFNAQTTGGATAPSLRIQAILIFRIDPPPTSAAPPPAGGPAPDVKAKQ